MAFSSYVREYFSISTIHGFSHIVLSRHLLEKFIWVILILLSIYSGWALSFITLNRYYTNPIVTSIERDKFSWSTPLPAATICPLKNLNETALNKYLEASNSANQTALKEFLISLFYANYSNFENVLQNDEIAPEDYLSIILKLQSRLKPEVTVSGQLLDSQKWVYVSITEMGVCYCFNSQLAVYNSPGYWNQNKWEIVQETKIFDAHPLDVEVFVNIVNLTTDFNVYLHGSYEIADVRSRPLFVGDTYFLQVYLTALSIISSEETRRLAISQRKCRYYFESNLKHSPVYTYALCRMECRIRLAIKLCGCVPHFYRKHPDEKVCNVKGLHCLSKFKDQVIFLENLEDECHCAANCEEVNYVVEGSDVREWFLGSNLQYGIKNFPDMRLKRDVIFGFFDLLVYIGGVMGFFLGCSVLSSIELVYYFTLRLYWFIVKQ